VKKETNKTPILISHNNNWSNI